MSRTVEHTVTFTAGATYSTTARVPESGLSGAVFIHPALENHTNSLYAARDSAFATEYAVWDNSLATPALVTLGDPDAATADDLSEVAKGLSGLYVRWGAGAETHDTSYTGYWRFTLDE